MRRARLLAAPLILGLWLLPASPASAAFEQVGCFAGGCAPVSEEKFPEETQLAGVGGMAVNYTGAGGVPAGTVYAATKSPEEPVRIAMFSPEAGGGLKFNLSWEVTPKEGPYERCGPGLGVPTKCQPRVQGGPASVDVDVDQSTGNVYVFNGEALGSPEFRLITIYKPDGSEVIARFGKRAIEAKTVAETPEEVHALATPGGIAVNGAGEIYLSDETRLSAFYHRLMVFRPKAPGNYGEYVYAGEVAAGASGEGHLPMAPVTDAAGNVYVAGDNYIEMYGPEAPANYPGSPATPICQFAFERGGITAITVNPQSGEAFFFSYKKEGGKKFAHQLGPCNEATGKFEAGGKEEIGKFTVSPERDDLWALAFDPVRQLPGRAPGVFYGGAPGAVPFSGVGAGEPGQSSLGYIFTQVEENPPAVGAESVSHVSATGALAHAVIDPEGHQTRYAFQYLTEAAYVANEPADRFAGASEAPLGGGLLGEGSQAQSVAASLAGLTPDTTYRFRAIATNHCSEEDPEKLCEDTGEDESFHTFPTEALGLPDDRAYELVSPPQKSSGQVLPADPRIDSCGQVECKPGGTYTRFPTQSAPGGGAIVYEGTPFEPEAGATIENEYISRRDKDTGWQTTNLSPRLLQSKGNGAGYKAFDTELSEGLLEQLRPALSPAAPPDQANLYSQPTDDPLALTPLLGEAAPNRSPTGSGEFKLSYAGASADLSRVFFAANDALSGETPSAPEAKDGGPTKFNLYEWERATGQLRLVNVKPGNAETEPGAAFGAGSAHAISTDGSKAFWSDQAGKLYVREEGEVTREIPDPGKFLAAASDGSKVLLSNGHLYDLEAEDLEAEGASVDLSEGKGGFQGIAGQSDDLSRVYFVDTAVLGGEEENSEGAKAQAAKDNLYVWSEGTTRFVATLLAQDNTGGANGLSSDWNSLPSVRTAQASPGGRFLAFISQASLTGYDNVGPCQFEGETEGFLQVPCPEAFLYDSTTGELSCPSCNPSGTAPLGWTVLRLINGPPSLPQPRYLSDSGRLLFDSQDSLTPLDTNEGIEDVYEYEPQGIGSCERAAGCVSLISAGTGVVDSNFLAMDETGRNVFFTTRDRLVAKDKDELIDLYDAREEGGIPAETETTRIECQGEACQPAASVPAESNLSSAGFQGPGNARQGGPFEPRCPKGKHKVRRKGKARCLKTHRHSARAAANRKHGGAR